MWKKDAPQGDEQNKVRFKALFMSKVSVAENGCWIWKAAIRKDGYGQFHISRKPMAAHRASYILNVGEIPFGSSVLHRCDNPVCVNPQHLFLGLPKDNSLDMVKKKRQAYGERHGMSKLTQEQVSRIKEMTGTQQQIADVFHVDRSTVGYIRRGKHWVSNVE